MSEAAADFVTILSSELIAEIVEAYFNNEMYKVPVKVVDLKPTADGYAFSLAFDSKKEENANTIAFVDNFYENGIALDDETVAVIERNGMTLVDERDKKGRFVKKSIKLHGVASSDSF